MSPHRAALLVFLAFSALSGPLRAAQERFYLGTFSHPGQSLGIYTGTIDSESGKLGPLTLAAKAGNPGYVALSPGSKYLYAVTLDKGGSVAAFAVQAADGSLKFLNEVPSGGSGPCYLSVDPSGRNVLVANYGDGSIVCIRIRGDGSLGEKTASIKFTGSGPNPDRQKQPHAHSIYTDAVDHFVYACDLGTDHVWTYGFDAEKGSIETEPALPPGAVPPGSGPRHLAFNPAQTVAYVNNEMGRSVTVLKRDVATGLLSPLQTISSVPGAAPGPSVTTAEIVCHPSGKWVYLSSRGDDILAVFSVHPDGTLEVLQDIPAGVKMPRGFGMDPAGRWLIVGGQADGKLAAFRIAPDTGRLTPAGMEDTAGAPVCVAFVPAK